MKNLLRNAVIFLTFTVSAYASPYADKYLYENMLDYIENPSKYRDNVINGYVVDNSSDIIVGAFIEKAFSVYKKEEEYTPEFTSCGTGCYMITNAVDIVNAYHKFFYMFAIANEITGVLIQNPQVNDNIEYIMKNKHISYKWYSHNKLLITIDNNKIEFIKDSKAITIKTDMKSLEKYRLN